MNYMIKKTLTILISIIFILSIPIYSQALSFDELIQSGKDFENAANNSEAVVPQESQMQGISKTVSNILLTIAIGVTLISGALMGINIIIQSAEEKAKIKESMTPWMIGIIITFGAYGIWKLTMQIFYDII